MIRMLEGNILNAPENIIGHQVNCQGVMGAGLAIQIRSKYPEVYTNYKEFVAEYRNKLLLGKMQLVTCGENKWVANLFGQFSYGRRKPVYTHYGALEDALRDLKNFAKEHGLSVALPYGIGCGLAGGDWEDVYAIIDGVFHNYEVVLYKFN
ncbi:macro domain-containing protein [Bacillus sp. AG4(2022)]|uniref:macro domain-containing protein n=1 Tax=Bacillus sp. AG4(2022) TaxID=2962594 RepID=UPI0028821238|nr:macro domain-containing protein [Bacillus sp. AG4(2022)]MDT0160376.1 macro domain-containing protein [Bacillus sp. AG4(2022)]